MGVNGFVEKLIKKMKQNPNATICFILGLYMMFYVWHRANGVLKTRPSPPPTPIFHVSDFVSEIHSGCLRQRDILLHHSEVSLVFYYAPWCHSSLKAAAHFIQAARKYHNEVSFIAINCWWIKGECREKSNNELNFPRLYLYHKSCRRPIKYNGPHLFRYYDAFLKKALLPVTYLGTSKSIDLFLKSSQITVIGSFSSSSAEMIRRYIEIALVSMKNFPDRVVEFGFVLSRSLSAQLVMKHKVLKLFDRTISNTYCAQEFLFQRNTTPDEVVKWALHQPTALQRIFSVGEKSNALYNVLKGGPCLVTFILDLNQLETINEIAIKYNTIKELHCHCCESFAGANSHSVCLKDGNSVSSPHSCALASVLNSRFRSQTFGLLSSSKESCLSTAPLYDVQRSRLEVCSLRNVETTFSDANTTHTSIEGLTHHTNRTLQFLAVDLNLTLGMAEGLGFPHRIAVAPFTVIVDLSNEQNYAMDGNFSKSNLENFVLNYTNGRLDPAMTPMSRRVMQHDVEAKDRFVTIPSVYASDFEDTILRSSKDVLVYYHSSWCGGCATYSHVLMTLQSRKDSFENLVIYQVGEQTNEELPYSFKALSYPTLILFPGNRTMDSVFFSKSALCTLPNIIGFLLRHASPATKAQLLLSVCSVGDGSGGKLRLPYDICRKQDIIERMKVEKFTLKTLRDSDKRLSMAMRRWQQQGTRELNSRLRFLQINQLRKEKRSTMMRLQRLVSSINSLTFLTV